jgi:hypothetical protein
VTPTVGVQALAGVVQVSGAQVVFMIVFDEGFRLENADAFRFAWLLLWQCHSQNAVLKLGADGIFMDGFR